MLSEAEKAEIRSEFRGAKDPEKQIAISAQLHNCRSEEVRAALEGTEPPAPKAKPEKKGYDAKFKSQAVEAVIAGGTVKSVAGQYGIAAATLYKWFRQAKPQEAAEQPKAGPQKSEPQPQPLLSETAAYSIQMLLNGEVNRWMNRLESELIEKGEAQQGTLGNLRTVLMARNEFFRLTLPGRKEKPDEKVDKPVD